MPGPKHKEGGKVGGKKKGKDKAVVLIDGLPITTMSREQLEGHVVRLRSELDKEREERNYFQLERDKLQSFWEITRQQLEAKKTELRESDKRSDETEERHLRDTKLLNQKMKHLLFDNQTKLAEAKTENLSLLKVEQKDHEQRQKLLMESRESLLSQHRLEEAAAQELIQKLRLRHSEELAKTRLQFQAQVTEIESKYQTKLKTAEKELKTRYETEAQELEESKKQHTDNLIRNHNKALMNMKNFYNDVTVNNMTLITTLKEQIVLKSDKEKKLEKKLDKLTVENQQLNGSLLRAQQENKDWEKQIKKCNKDKEILANARKQLLVSGEEIKTLKWESEILKQSFLKVEKERDDLHEKFASAIQEVQQKSSLKNMLLEKKWQTLEQIMENNELKLPISGHEPKNQEPPSIQKTTTDTSTSN